jgi:hypothetical protein
MDSLPHFLSTLGTLCCGVFAGAAIYINAVEHPARMSCGASAAFAQWAPSYARGTVMQAPLAVAGFLFAIAAWWLGAATQVLIAGSVLLLVVPFTLVVIMPTNKRLSSLAAEPHTEAIGVLLARWNRLHAVRSALSLIAFAIFLSADR